MLRRQHRDNLMTASVSVKISEDVAKTPVTQLQHNILKRELRGVYCKSQLISTFHHQIDSYDLF